jgi:phage shock protein PspC (stress-responsive transcriptional regulator)
MERANDMDETPRQEGGSGTGWNLRELRKSDHDRKIAGICGGFGEYTPVPSWLWRVAFVASIFAGGLGLVAYVILWVSMPSAKNT